MTCRHTQKAVWKISHKAVSHSIPLLQPVAATLMRCDVPDSLIFDLGRVIDHFRQVYEQGETLTSPAYS